MYTSPDGYKGWVGPYIYDEDYICDAHIGDVILLNPMLDFAETVLKNSGGQIQNQYAANAKSYVALTKKHLFEKWDSRGTWREYGPYGAYISWDHYLTPGHMDEWRELPVGRSNLTLPFNKNSEMGVAALRLYRITGEEKYREKALKIFNAFKSRMCLYKDHYVWNYWEPFGEWDIESAEKNSLRHWVNVHPYRNYQASEVHDIVEAYHTGVTFTKQDIQRIINTNIDVMWNGDRENPEWHNSNYAVQKDALGEVPTQKAPGGHFPKLAGTLWTALDDFSPTVRELSGNTYSSPPGFERHHAALPVTKFQRPFHKNNTLIMAAAMPSVLDSNTPSYLVCQTRVGGPLQIALVSKDGQTEIETIREGRDKDRARIYIVPWDGGGHAAGAYRIRWRMGEEYRDFPIRIK
jgi:hypothetical protein